MEKKFSPMGRHETKKVLLALRFWRLTLRGTAEGINHGECLGVRLNYLPLLDSIEESASYHRKLSKNGTTSSARVLGNHFKVSQCFEKDRIWGVSLSQILQWCLHECSERCIRSTPRCISLSGDIAEGFKDKSLTNRPTLFDHTSPVCREQ
jgi:hypothetical protein